MLGLLEQNQLVKWMPLLRGARVLQLGDWPKSFDILAERAATYYCLSGAGETRLSFDYQSLPFKPELFDFVVVSHVLETVEYPSLVLKEVYDCMAPNAKCLIFCFNAWSPYYWLTYWLKIKNQFPQTELKARSPWHTQQCLTALGFTVLKDKTLGFGFHEVIGQMTVPMLGAVNVVLVEKQVVAGLPFLRYHWAAAKSGLMSSLSS